MNHPNVEEFEYMWSFSVGGWSPAEWAEHYAKGLRAKIATLEGYIEQLRAEIPTQRTTAPAESTLSANASKKVFIVHGHDGELKEATARLVTKLGLAPIILHEQANKGRTVIEKFADHAQEVGFAVVLLSADDEGRSRDAPSDPLKLRARQNVIFEMGFFFRRLGRGRVCAVYQRRVELPSDVHGILYVEYDQAGRWMYDVAKEIKEAGYAIDLNKV